jgi:hypothetical protein
LALQVKPNPDGRGNAHAVYLVCPEGPYLSDIAPHFYVHPSACVVGLEVFEAQLSQCFGWLDAADTYLRSDDSGKHWYAEKVAGSSTGHGIGHSGFSGTLREALNYLVLGACVQVGSCRGWASTAAVYRCEPVQRGASVVDYPTLLWAFSDGVDEPILFHSAKDIVCVANRDGGLFRQLTDGPLAFLAPKDDLDSSDPGGAEVGLVVAGAVA